LTTTALPRPYGQNSWNGKPAAVVSVSIGNISGFGANHHLRQSLVFVNVPVMAQPEAYIGSCSALFNDQGKLTNEDTNKFLTTFMSAFEKWVEANARK
jgi:chromate reductase